MKILVIQTAFIGDVVLTTPFLEALRKRWPRAELHVVATPPGCEILANLESVICHPIDKRREGVVKGMRKTLNSLGRGTEFDFVFSVHRSLRSLALARKVRGRRKIAFRSFWARFFNFETVAYPPYDESVHFVDKPMALLKAVDVKAEVSAPAPRLAVSAADREAAEKKLAPLLGRGDGGYLVVSPFSVWGTKMWFADRFARTAAELSRKHSIPIVVIGGGANLEATIGDTIVEKVENAGGRGLSLVGKTSLGELKAVIKNANLVLANDSAPVHIAAAFQVPTVAIFGPTVRKWGFFPLSPKSAVIERFDVPCRPCHIHGPVKCPKRHFRCMDQIQVEDVVSAVEKLMVR